MKANFWMMVAIALFIIASARFYGVGDPFGASVFGLVALVFALRVWIEIRRRKRGQGSL